MEKDLHVDDYVVVPGGRRHERTKMECKIDE